MSCSSRSSGSDVPVPRRKLLVTVALLPLWPQVVQATVQAVPSEVAAESPGARLMGASRLRYLGLSVYDIRLWSANAKAASEPTTTLLALELEYARSLPGTQIADAALKEMQGIEHIDAAQVQAWLARLRDTFPDVNRGDRITGVQRPGEGTRFFVNGVLKGEVRDADFTRRFFAIWLSPSTSQPRLREALLSGRGSAS